MENNYLVIMAGGIGSRFWPMSTVDKPKQFLDVLNIGRTLIQQTVDRFEGIVAMKNIYVVTSAKYKDIVQEQLPELCDQQVLLEPCMRNTAPCIAYAVWKIKKQNSNANIVVAPSDHLITNGVGFRQVISEGLNFTLENDVLLTLGMKPHKPETGYGYIQIGEKEGTDLFQVKRFAEKPNIETATRYLASGDFFWNSGIFVWSAKSIEKAIRSFLPDVANIFDKGIEVLNTADEQSFINADFPTCQNVSVDYGIIEHAMNIYVRVAYFGWSDLGTWGSLHELSNKTTEQNAVKGNVKTFETQNSVIRVEDPNKKVIVQGLDNFIVVDTGEALLICNKDEEQRIKEFQK